MLEDPHLTILAHPAGRLAEHARRERGDRTCPGAAPEPGGR